MATPTYVLLVEDDEDDQWFFSKAITEIDRSMHLYIAGNGLEALTVLEKAPVLPNVIFLDINMPIMDGLDCLQRLKCHPQFENIPVIVLTATKGFVQEKLSFTLGAKLFLIKPSIYPTLKLNISAALESIIMHKFAS